MVAEEVERTELFGTEEEELPEHVPLNKREARHLPKVKAEKKVKPTGVDVKDPKAKKKKIPAGKRRVVKTINKTDAKGYQGTLMFGSPFLCRGLIFLPLQ